MFLFLEQESAQLDLTGTLIDKDVWEVQEAAVQVITGVQVDVSEIFVLAVVMVTMIQQAVDVLEDQLLEIVAQDHAGSIELIDVLEDQFSEIELVLGEEDGQ